MAGRHPSACPGCVSGILTVITHVLGRWRDGRETGEKAKPSDSFTVERGRTGDPVVVVTNRWIKDACSST